MSRVPDRKPEDVDVPNPECRIIGRRDVRARSR